jgi:Patatin-like phospholipase
MPSEKRFLKEEGPAMTEPNVTDTDSPQSSNPKPKTFYKYESGKDYAGAEEFIAEEFKKVNSLRNHKEANKEFIGLALSGGGIRSATFSLGVLQALAEKSWLEKIDYLSTVSGGGYLGSALTWLLHKPWETNERKTSITSESGVLKRFYKKLTAFFRQEEFKKVQFKCSPGQFPFNGDMDLEDTDGDPVKNGKLYKLGLLAFLRQHGKYLAPGNGITLLSFISALLRGTLVSLIIFIPLTASVFYAALQKFKIPEQYPKEPTGIFDKFADTFPLIGHMNAPFQIACLLILIFLFLVIVYAIGTLLPFMGNFKLYHLRRLYDQSIRLILGTTAFSVLIGSVILVHSFLKGYEFATILSGLGSIIAGIIPFFMQFIKSSKNEQTNAGKPLVILLSAGILLFGFLLLSYHLAQSHFLSSNSNWMLWGIAGIAILAYITQINYISIHRYYRDRLMEAYMPDVGNIFNQKWASILPANEADGAQLSKMKHKNGPYHIINTNVITTDSTIPKFKGRGGDSFILSPYFCGSNATSWTTTPTFMGGLMTLSTAMSISGAAVNPNTGVGGEGLTRNPLVSLVMKILNIRLGYWVPHPNRPWYLKIWPPNFINPYLISQHKEDSDFLELSDGGHFENLGLYELFRRRMKTIIICDGGADKDFTFEDLGNALEKARVDFGVTIEIITDPLVPLSKWENHKTNTNKAIKSEIDKNLTGNRETYNEIHEIKKREEFLIRAKKDMAERGYVFGKITYRNSDECLLVYLKTTFINDLPPDIIAYKNKHNDFPDQSTADQFFDEKQFEAYRELGYQIAHKMIDDITTVGTSPQDPSEEEEIKRKREIYNRFK